MTWQVPFMQALIVAALETACRRGELHPRRLGRDLPAR